MIREECLLPFRDISLKQPDKHLAAWDE